VPQIGYGPSIQLTHEERELFQLLRRVRKETGLSTTLRVAGGWVRDKLLATPEFQAYHKVFEIGTNSKTARLTSKFRTSSPKTSLGRLGTKVLVNPQNHGQPVDIDIALDDMLGREFADHLNEYLSAHGKDEVSVGVVLKNPEKSKHLETATMKVGGFWIDFVNLRAEEYTQDSRIPDLMRIGTADEDAHRRDLTINSLYYNINTGDVEDWTGRGFSDLRKGVVSTPLSPLTTLLDDPLRILRSIRFAARLRFTMDPELIEAAQTRSVALALSQKVSRERVGGELDLMLRSPDPVGAVRLLVNLKLADCVFPAAPYYRDIILQQIHSKNGSSKIPQEKMDAAVRYMVNMFFERGVNLLSTAHDHLADCRWSPPIWCLRKKAVYGATEKRLIDDEETRRLLWYAAFLKPLYDDFKLQQANAKKVPKRQEGSRKANRSIVSRILVDELKRPTRDADAIGQIMKAADDFTQLLCAGCDVSATMILLSRVHVTYVTSSMDVEEYCDIETGSCENGSLLCSMNGRVVHSVSEDDPVWEHAMEFRLLCSKVMQQIGPLWRAALFLAISEELVRLEKQDGLEYAIEGDVIDETHSELRQGAMERFDSFAAALQQIGLIGIWNEKPVIDGDDLRKVLPSIPKGPAFREVMDEQLNWMITHPGADRKDIEAHLISTYPDYTEQPKIAAEKIKKIV
jgi:tRNA nucleotidyltransferase (CCA-adding enzyme)